QRRSRATRLALPLAERIGLPRHDPERLQLLSPTLGDAFHEPAEAFGGVDAGSKAQAAGQRRDLAELPLRDRQLGVEREDRAAHQLDVRYSRPQRLTELAHNQPRVQTAHRGDRLERCPLGPDSAAGLQSLADLAGEVAEEPRDAGCEHREGTDDRDREPSAEPTLQICQLVLSCPTHTAPELPAALHAGVAELAGQTQ